MATLEDIKQNSLQGLPPEMRNRIYRLALVSADPIDLTYSDGHTEPAILRTCRQFRQEGTGIFRSENTFSLTILLGCLATSATHWANKLTRRRQVIISFKPGKKWWAYLMPWLRTYHAGETGLRCWATADRDSVAASAFDIVHSLRSVPWEKVREVLQHYRDGVMAEEERSRHIMWGVAAPTVAVPSYLIEESMKSLPRAIVEEVLHHFQNGVVAKGESWRWD